MWTCSEWDLKDGEEKKVTFPKALLNCEEVAREVVFYSEEEIKDFQLLQKVHVGGEEIEQLYFRFGFVMPKS